jgi:hypothetical protein
VSHVPADRSAGRAGIEDLQDPGRASRLSAAHAQLVVSGGRDAYAEKFGAAHKVDLPFVLDPGGKLAAQVNADRDLGKAIKLDHTPTVYIVSSRNPSKPYVEVKDNSQLYSTIDAVMKE